jgi:uncharacterized protein
MNWNISAPFMYVLQLEDPARGTCARGQFCLDEKERREIFEKILPTARHIFLEGGEPLGNPRIFSILDFLDSHDSSFSILTDGLWDNPDELLLKLQKYSRLEKIRFDFRGGFQSGISSTFEKFRANLVKTVAAGIISVVVVPPTVPGSTDEQLSALLATGISGINFSFGKKASGDFNPQEALARAEKLSAAGLPIFIEGCAPIGFRPGGACRCPAGDALAFIDQSGNLFPCLDDGLSPGNLLEKSMEELWGSRMLRAWRKERWQRRCFLHAGSSYTAFSATSPGSGPPVNIDRDLVPFPLFDLRKEKFGAILIRGYDYIPVSRKALGMLAMLDGNHSLGEIDGKFGQTGLSFAFGLFAEDMLRFDRPESQCAGMIVSGDEKREPGGEDCVPEPAGYAFPAGPTRHIPAEPLPGNWFCKTTPNLYLSRRNDRILVVEPESASWCVLSEKQSEILNRIDRSGGTTIGEIAGDRVIDMSSLTRLILLLFQRNMISINGKTFFKPGEMWKDQEYPHYFNLHMTEACNLACKYCRVNSIPESTLMSPDTCRTIVRRVLEEIPGGSVIISFHGGEPLLNPEAIVAGADEARKMAAECNKKVKLVMQTNATLLTAETARLLKQHSVDVGVSIDGCQSIHDQRRVYHNGEGTHADVVRGIRAAAGEGVPVGYLAVVHEPQQYPRVLDYLAGEMGAASLRINYSAFDGRGKEQLNFPVDRPASFARDWLKMLDYAEDYYEKTGKWLSISDLNLFIFHLVSKIRPHMCYRSPCGMGNSILGFAPDGKIYLCDEVVGNPEFRVGDIFEPTPLREMLEKSLVKKSVMNKRRVENIARCSTCTWKHFHGGGCASKTFSYFGMLNREDPMCRFYEVVFEELMWRLADKPHLVNLCGSYREQLDMDSAMNYLKNGLEDQLQH